MFTHNGETWTTGWPLADEQNWKFFRLSDGNLASELVDRAKSRELPLARLVFDYKAYDNGVLADVQQHIGRGGWLRVSRLTVKTAQTTIEHLLLAMVADDGAVIDHDTVDRLFCVPASALTELRLTPPNQSLDASEAATRKRRLDEAEQSNAEFLSKETDKLDGYAEDLEKSADTEIKALDAEIKAKRKEMRSTVGLSVANKVEMQRAIKKLEGHRDDRAFAKFERKKAIRKEVEDILDSIQASLKFTPTLTPIFTIRWEIHG
jgi:hypothetical protein